jgi:SAM-dependent methyltransferase
LGELTLSPVQTDPEWRRRRDVAARHFVPWLQRVKPLGEATILEYGCGTGPVCCAFAPHVARHIGYDIVPEAIDLARGHVRAAGADNVELHAARADRILEAVAQHRGEVDVMLLYAVLEHMTPRERLDLLELALELVRPEGLVVVIESPNRLCAVDWHTSFLPFLCQLPEELALAYAHRSQRPDYLEALEAAAAEGAEAHREVFVRWGRGLSFHEFELVLGDLERHVVAGGYERELMVERPVHAEEMALARQLERSRPDLPPVFSRYWLDFALTPEPRGAPGLMWPWVMETSRESDARWTRWDTIELQPGRPLPIEFPCATSRVMVTVSFRPGTGYVTLIADGMRWRERAAAAPSNEAHVEFRLPAERDTFSLTMSDPGYLHFVGYEAPAKRAGTVFAGQ